MKRCLMCLLLAGVVFSLAAQTTQRVGVYMPPVGGTGFDERDNAFFYMQMYRELTALSYITLGTSSSSEFSLIGALSEVGRDERPPYGEHRFELNLYDNKTGLILSEQRYRYGNLTNADVAVKAMLSNILALIQPPQTVQQPTQPPAQQPVQQPTQPVQQPTQPVQQPVQQPTQPVQQPVQPPAQPVQQPVQPPAQPVQQPVQQPFTPKLEDDWRDRLLFFSAAAFWTPRLYVGDTQASNLVNFGAGLYTEYRFMESVSVETGFELASDSVPVLVQVSGAADTPEYYQNVMLEVPVLIKLVLKPGDIFLLEPYSGVYLNFPFLIYTKPPLLSWVAGYQHAVRTGPGALFFDFRVSVDLGLSSVEKRPNRESPDYHRYRMSFSVGYKYGIFSTR